MQPSHAVGAQKTLHSNAKSSTFEALEISRRVSGPEHQDRMGINALADTLTDKGNYPEGEKWTRRLASSVSV
jgi:hypothetical protein